MVVQHLIAHGHTRIMHITGGAHVTGARRRLEGYLRALAAAQIPVDRSLIVDGSYSIWTGREKMTEWLTSARALPTAIFCANDAIAYGCMEVLAAAGISVPDQVSIAGFDDTLMARTMTPAVTTIRQPFREMGRRAVELVLEQIRTDAAIKAGAAANLVSAPATPETELLPVELVVRGSVGPARVW
jgi:LacI family transcriptional regulator